MFALNTAKGEFGSGMNLDSPPEWDGLLIAQGRLEVANVSAKANLLQQEAAHFS